ncbi:MAG TPA: DUF1269 domain-containing protein [Solirubrobacteraceae bacterium]|nr:DUF1269 domain-containing protein [Solirubrobacteraceae bacterium]
MSLDLALVCFHGQSAAAAAFGTMRDRAGADAAWTHEVALLEHHHNGRISLRGTFAGHYVDVDEADHLSQHGAATGALTGGVIGLLFLGGPIGMAPGIVVGAAIGAEGGKPDEVEFEPQALVEELRAAVPKGSSAIVLLAEPSHVDAMLETVDSDRAEVVRHTLAGEQLDALIASVGTTPAASSGPRPEGDEAGAGPVTD